MIFNLRVTVNQPVVNLTQLNNRNFASCLNRWHGQTSNNDIVKQVPNDVNAAYISQDNYWGGE